MRLSTTIKPTKKLALNSKKLFLQQRAENRNLLLGLLKETCRASELEKQVYFRHSLNWFDNIQLLFSLEQLTILTKSVGFALAYKVPILSIEVINKDTIIFNTGLHTLIVKYLKSKKRHQVIVKDDLSLEEDTQEIKISSLGIIFEQLSHLIQFEEKESLQTLIAQFH